MMDMISDTATGALAYSFRDDIPAAEHFAQVIVAAQADLTPATLPTPEPPEEGGEE